MIKLVQGFDIGSPLPIDGRILLTKEEMINNVYIDPDTGASINLDNILPSHYFAFCKDDDDNRLYLYRKDNDLKNDDETREFGRFVLADKELHDKIDKINEDLNEKIDANFEILDDKTDANFKTLDEKIDAEVSDLQSQVDSLDSKLDDEIARATSREESILNKLTNDINKVQENLDEAVEALENEDARIETKLDDYIESTDAHIAEMVEDIELNAIHIDEEEEARLENDNVLRQSIIDEASARSNADNEILTLVNEHKALIDANRADININKEAIAATNDLLDDTISDFDAYRTSNNTRVGNLETHVEDVKNELNTKIDNEVSRLEEEIEQGGEGLEELTVVVNSNKQELTNMLNQIIQKLKF